ncbi:MAG: hypothetical protein ACTSQQ_09105, partial [Candidatus Helarchaeota archaeon]
MQSQIKHLKYGLIVPDDILSKEDYLSLNQFQKQRYVERILYKIFDLNAEDNNGITINQLVNVLPFSRNTVQNHLNRLFEKREIYYISGTPKKYFKNGRISHKIEDLSFYIDNKKFTFQLLANNIGPLKIFIREKKMDEYGETNTTGGIIIDSNQFDKF